MKQLLDKSPVARAGQKLAEVVTRGLFLRAYEISDDAYWRRFEAPQRWQSLGDIVEYSEGFLAVTCDNAEPVYLIGLRAVSHALLRRVSVKLKVKKGGELYQETITIDRLDDIPVRKALTQIPLKPKHLSRTKGAKLGDVYIKLVEAIDIDGEDLVAGRRLATIFSPTCSVSALDHYEQRWGQFWNTDQITLARQLIKNRWYRRLVQSAGQLWRPLRVRRLAYWMMTNQAALSLQFWMGNLFGARGLMRQVAKSQRPAVVGGGPSARPGSDPASAIA